MKNLVILVLLGLIGVGAWFQWGPPTHRAAQTESPPTGESPSAEVSPGASSPATPAENAAPASAVAGMPPLQNAVTPGAAPVPNLPRSPDAPLSAAEFAKRVADSQRRAIARYPDLGKSSSQMNARFVSRYKLMMAEHSPKLQDPGWPLSLAEETAAASGVRGASVAGQPPAASPIPLASVVSALAKAVGQPGAVSPSPNPDADKPPLISLNVTSMNAGATYDIHWLTYYDGYDIAGHANKALDLDARNLSNHASQVAVQWIFTGRKHGKGARFIFDMGSGNWDMKPNQSTHLGVRSADLASRTIWYSDYGYGYYSGSEIDGWIVLARFKDKVIRMVGSSGTLESMVGTPEFEKMIADYKASHPG